MRLVPGDEFQVQRMLLIDIVPFGIIEQDEQADLIRIVDHVTRR